jgi:hypothetical protein
MKIFIQWFYIILFIPIIPSKTVLSQSEFYNTNNIQKVEIRFTQPNWDYQLDTAKIGTDGYLMADWVVINGTVMDSAGVKYKGNSSYDSAYLKNPLHISLNEFKNQSYQGFTDVKLSNAHSDPSIIREVLAYKILSDYMDCPGSNFAQVYVNDEYIGIYTNVESINTEFCSDIFYTSDGILIKASPADPGPYSRSNLNYISGDSADYFNLYEIKSGHGWNELVSLCNMVTNEPGKMDSIFDIDKVLWMLAFNNVLVNLDSYSGAFAQNYYLYKDNHNQYNPMVWDLNMSFGGFPFAGMQGGGMGGLLISDMQNLPISLHFSDSDWPLIKNVMSNDRFKKMYRAHFRTIAMDVFTSQLYADVALQLQATIDTAVQSDVNKFFTYEQFLGGLTTNIQFGSYMIPGISVLMEARMEFLQGTPEFNYPSPGIASVVPENPNPELNSEVIITAQITNTDANSVYLNYRFGNTGNFKKVNMFDDGLHHDGSAGDNVFGASFIMESEWADYYIYAENSQSGMFSPERAEHEFYSLKADIVVALPGEIIINELLTINQNDTVDEAGEHEDWIELYNNTDTPVDLYGLYLTDDFTNPMKFAFPENSTVQPHNFFIIWADEDSTTSSWLHCNFKLSGNGEEIMLSDIDGNVFDSLSFGPQPADISLGRCPDGAGNFDILSNTTFNSANCESGIAQILLTNNEISVYPNPANAKILIVNSFPADEKKIQVVNIMGEKFYSGLLTSEIIINTSLWPSGVYAIIQERTVALKFIVKH